MKADSKMVKCKEQEPLNGMTEKYMKVNSIEDNFMGMEQCSTQMDRWSKGYGIEVKTYKCKKQMQEEAK